MKIPTISVVEGAAAVPPTLGQEDGVSRSAAPGRNVPQRNLQRGVARCEVSMPDKFMLDAEVEITYDFGLRSTGKYTFAVDGERALIAIPANTGNRKDDAVYYFGVKDVRTCSSTDTSSYVMFTANTWKEGKL